MKIKISEFKKVIAEAHKELTQKVFKVGPEQLKKLVENLADEIKFGKKKVKKNSQKNK